MVDEGWPGNNERGLPVEWYGSLKNLSKKHREKRVDTEAKIVPTGGVSDFLPPPPPPTSSKTNRAPWYVSRQGVGF